MRIRVSYATDVDDDYRRAINAYYGKPGLASRQDVKDWLQMHGTSMDDNLMYELSQRDDERARID